MGRKKFNMDPKKVPICFKNKTTKKAKASSWVTFCVGCEEGASFSCEICHFQSSLAELLFSSPQGIQFMLENDLLQNTPEDIAQFLYKGEGLNKTVIGDYLGERWGVCHADRKKLSVHEVNTRFGAYKRKGWRESPLHLNWFQNEILD